MAAEILIDAGLNVDLYDAMPSLGRKFLMAGKGGMNISHSEPIDLFLSRYGSRQSVIEPSLADFPPQALRDWVQQLGINTFIGSSGRVFPTDMKAAPLLRAWLRRLRVSGVNFHVRHRWLGWYDGNNASLKFSTPDFDCNTKADAVVFALGGGSWKQLGSNGEWVSLFKQRGIKIAPLKPSNCGFEVKWSDFFRNQFSGQPLKSVFVSFIDHSGSVVSQQGEFVITENGIEGGVIYSLSSLLREEIANSGFAMITIDLLPNKDLPTLIKKISKNKGKNSMANHLRKCVGIDGVKAALLREVVSRLDYNTPEKLCSAMKALPIKLIATRPLDEAISSAGGLLFEELDEHLMIRSMPGIFCAGEMLDWEAPTGGYLLTACFASGRAAAMGVLEHLKYNATSK
jgi:uncharacterized flavoprotein (TIGR03862 family)